MSRVISNTRQILDEQGDARQGPEIRFVAVSQRASQQGLGHLLCLFDRQFRFRPGGSLAGQGGLAAFVPCLFPALSHLTGHAQSASDLGGGIFLGEEFGRLLAALFHCGVISRFVHAPIIARPK